MPEATIASLAEKLPGLVLMNAYGSTETCSPSTIMPPGDTAAHPDSVGKAVPCAEIRIVDKTGNERPRDEPGEIWIKGPMVVPGYWNDPEKTAAEFSDGYWRSGDVGSMDREGYVRLHDRMKDVINRGGYNVYSAELENTLSFHPDIIECAAVAEPDEILGEKIHVFVRTRSQENSTEELRQFCSDRLVPGRTTAAQCQWQDPEGSPPSKHCGYHLRQRPTWLGAAFIVAVALPVFAIINVELTWFL